MHLPAIRATILPGYNLLDGSTAFPPEPMERPADLPVDIPWYGKATSAEPDPYVYAGFPDDYPRDPVAEFVGPVLCYCVYCCHGTASLSICTMVKRSSTSCRVM